MRFIFAVGDLSEAGGIQNYNRHFLKTIEEIGGTVRLIERKKGFFGRVKFTANFFWEIVRCRPDVVICGHINFSPIVYFLNLFLKFKFVIITHGVDVWNIKSRLQLAALRKADRIITVSFYTRDKILEQLSEVSVKIFILPNSVDGNTFLIKLKPKYLEARHGLAGSKIILTVARLSADEVGFKGYDRVVLALPQILGEVPNAKYLLVGNGDDLPRIKELAKKLGVDDRVIFAGRVSGAELVDYYNLADVFIMPSKCEGFGIVFLEALACGVPVIAGNKDASSEAVLGGRLGRLIDPDSIEEISHATVSALSENLDASDRQGLRRIILENYGTQIFEKHTLELIDVLKNKAPIE